MTDFIQVAWNVASESNTNYYQVERSTDQQHFASVGSVMATGTMAYGLPDHDVVPGTRYFYRVRAVDADGLTTLSNTVEAILAADGTVMYNVFPNPTSAGFNVVYNTSLNGPMSLELFDATGRLVYQQRTEMQAGSHTLVVPAQALSAGVYNLRLTSPAGTEVVRVVRN
jgi:hypothetical protein